MSINEVDGASATIESTTPAVSWGPIFAGAIAATAVTLLMMFLGSGFGLTVLSPWPSESSSAATFAVSAAIWIVLMQWVSSAVGGYLTGRLRTKWSGIHTDEIYFRDTAHGFVAWALATLFMAALASSVITSTISSGVQAVSSVTSGATNAVSSAAGQAVDDGSVSYFVDSLMRPATPTTGGDQNAQAATEASRILLNAATTGEMPAEDRTYLEQLVASRSGLSEADAKAQVDVVLGRVEAAKQTALEAAETARKTGAATAFITALSMLIGAFIASAAAALGGRQRDDEEEVHLSTRTRQPTGKAAYR